MISYVQGFKQQQVWPIGYSFMVFNSKVFDNTVSKVFRIIWPEIEPGKCSKLCYAEWVIIFFGFCYDRKMQNTNLRGQLPAALFEIPQLQNV